MHPLNIGAFARRTDTWESLANQVDGQTLYTYHGDLFVGGWQVLSEQTACMGIGRWDGQAWHSLGQGESNYVTALSTSKGELIGGGTFYLGEVTHSGLARRVGQAWQPLAPSLSEDGNPEPNINSIAEYNGHIVVGGSFSNAGDVPCNGIASWDGQQWHAFGDGMRTDRMTGSYHDVRGGSVYALAVYSGDLIAGGSFDSAGGVPCCAAARWDGQQWHAMDTGLDGVYHTYGRTLTRYNRPSIQAFALYRSELYAAGIFSVVGDVPSSNIARWDGTRWQPLGSGITSPGLGYCVAGALAIHNDQLIVAGCFSQAGQIACDSVAAWDGQQWHALSGPLGPYAGRASSVHALTVFGSRLIAAGRFTPLDPNCDLSEFNAWDGQQWQSLGGQTNGEAYMLLPHGGELVVAGWFTAINGMVSNQLAYLVPQYQADINNDSQVNVADLMLLVTAWGTAAGDAAYSAPADINENGHVNIGDLQILVQNWGK